MIVAADQEASLQPLPFLVFEVATGEEVQHLHIKLHLAVWLVLKGIPALNQDGSNKIWC
jgi:hypothetical protein